jgi:ABC-type uncharacterized transport system involved in gliding motility auxiliary subunit
MADPTPKPEKVPTLGRRKLAISANLFVQIVLGLGLVVAANWLVARHYRRFDWTKSGYYQVSAKTRQVLDGLKDPVEVVVFLQPSAQSQHVEKIYQDARDLLKEFEFFGRRKLHIEYVDPQRDRTRAEQLVDKYKVDTPNVVIFACGDRHKYVTLDEMVELDESRMGGDMRIKAFKGEGAFLSAIQSVTEEKPPQVYFLTGHGEHDPDGLDEQKGYSTLSQYIKRDNIKTAKWNLLEKQALPADAGAIVIAGPTTKFTPVEITVLDDYLKKRGGRLFVMLDPRHETGLDDYLRPWGVQVDSDLVLAKGGVMFGAELLVANALGSEYAPHAITRKLAGVNTTFPYARSVRRCRAAPVEGGAPPTVTELVKTPAAFWGETDLDAKRATYDDGKDVKGPLPLAVAVEASKLPGVDLEAGQYRMVVVGTSGFVENGELSGGNLDFFMNALNWLLKREQLMSVSPKLPQEFRLDMSLNQVRAVYGLVVVGLPLAVALLGLLVWARRRK